MKRMTTFSFIAIAILAMVTTVSGAGPPMPYFNGFENPDDVSTDGTYPPGDTMFFVERVPTGSNSITSAAGGWHGEAAVTNFGAPDGFIFTRYGGYGSVFPLGGYTTSIDVYLDTNASPSEADIQFDWSSAINGPDGNHRRDFIFSVGTDGDGGFVMSASNNAPGWPANPGRNPYTISNSGWYTFEHIFYDDGTGVLAVDMRVLNDSGNVLSSWTLSDPSDIIGGTVGGNRYGWLVTNEFTDLALDNVTRSGAVAAILKGKCKGGQWDLEVLVNSQGAGSFICEEHNKINEEILLPAGSGEIIFSAVGPGTRNCSGTFSYEQDLDKFKLECKDGSKAEKVEAKFELK